MTKKTLDYNNKNVHFEYFNNLNNLAYGITFQEFLAQM